MKKIVLTLVLLFTFTSVVTASSINGYVNGTDYPIVNVIYNGEVVNVEETPAFLFNSNTVIPIKMLREMGFTVDWEAETYSVIVTPPDPVVIIQEPTTEPVTEPTTGTVTEPTTGTTDPTTDPTTGEPTTETPTEEPTTETPVEEPTTEPVVDNTAECDEIRNETAYQISILGQKYDRGKITHYTLILEYERDKKLAALGCN